MKFMKSKLLYNAKRSSKGMLSIRRYLAKQTNILIEFKVMSLKFSRGWFF